MSLSRLRSERVWVPLALGVMSLLFVGEFLNPPPGQYLGGWDVVTQLLQSLRLARSELAAGHLPLWNPYLSSGLPLWANPQPGLLYLPNWILLGVPWQLGLSWLKAFHIFWTGLGMYVWARGQRIGLGGALVGALTFSYCGLMTVRVADGHPNFSAALAWLPWAMAALDRSLRRRTLKSAVVFGLPLAMAVYAGNPAGGFLIGGLAALWTLAETVWPPAPPASARDRWLFPLRQLAIGGTAAAGLSAAQLLPTLELIAHSVRTTGQGYEFASQFSLPLAHLIAILVPNFFGEPVRLGYWGEFGQLEYVLYPGLLAILLAGVALRYGHEHRPVRLWLALIGLGLLLALGPAGGLHPLAYRAFPWLGLVRVPTRFAIWSLFALASLAAWAVDYLAQHADRHWDSPASVALLTGVPTALSVLMFAAYTFAPAGDARLYHLGAALLQAALFFGLAGALLYWRPRLSGAVFVGLAVTLTISDLWGYGVRELRTTAEGQDRTWQQAAALIRPTGSPPPRVLPWGMGIFQQNLVMDAGLASVLSYDPLTLSDYQTFIDSVPDPRATTFDILSAEYLLIPADQAQWRQEANLEYIGQAGSFGLYRRKAALPRAWIAPQARVTPALGETLAAIHAPGFDPRQEALVGADPGCPAGSGGTAKITQFAPSALTVATDGGGVLVLSEAWYPGWQAAVDGLPVEVFKADGVLRGVCVPAGEHTVTFRFDPPLVKWGLGLTGASILITAGLLLLWKEKGYNAPDASGQQRE